MTNEEILKAARSLLFSKSSPFSDGQIIWMMDVARKDEAIAFGEFLFDYDVLDTKIDFLYQHRVSKETFYPDELYELFKKEK